MKPAIICPLEYEARFARRRLGDLADVFCAGPYRSGMERVFDSGMLDGRQFALLLGVAGGLQECALAPNISRVVDQSGNGWAIENGKADSVGATVLGVDEIAADGETKRSLGQTFGAQLVDMESHVFAPLASERGLRWRVVRGVSDGPDDSFPAWVADLLDEQGGVRIPAVIKRITAHPSSVGVLRRLGRDGARAMRAACARAREILEEETR